MLFWVAYLKHNQSNYVVLIYFFPKYACLSKQPTMVDLIMLIYLFCIN